jgi:two-component system, NarL family, nitrate/nitrite response regulator NarL
VAAIRVLIVDDHTLFAEAIRSAFEAVGVKVVGMLTEGRLAVESVRREQPDVVLLDIGLPDQSGLVVGEEIHEAFPDVALVALTALEDPRMVTEALRIGFRGYITKNMPVARFLRAVQTAVDGQVVIPQSLAFNRFGRASDGDDLVAVSAGQLTAREREVLALLVQGLNGSLIARRLSISGNTVRTHVQSILTKLQVHSRLEAATFAVRHGLVDPPTASTKLTAVR